MNLKLKHVFIHSFCGYNKQINGMVGRFFLKHKNGALCVITEIFNPSNQKAGDVSLL